MTPSCFRLIAAIGLLLSCAQGQTELSDDELVIRVKGQGFAGQGTGKAKVAATPPQLMLPVGQEAKLEAEVVDIGGRPVSGVRVVFFSRARRSLRVGRDGTVKAIKPGVHTVVARAARSGRRGPSTSITIRVPYPTPAAITFRALPERVYVGAPVRISAAVVDDSGGERTDLEAVISSSNPGCATVDAFGFVTGVAPGKVTVRAASEGLSVNRTIQVVENPVTSMTLTPGSTEARTGDVITFQCSARDGGGAELSDVPVHYSFHARPDDNLGQAATGQIEQDGRFVAEAPGLYSIVATCGGVSARATVRVNKRFKFDRKIKMVGQGRVDDSHTSDLWVWEGVDGRDYCVTGTWGSNGDAHFWDVTNPADIKRIATVNVDARTVNDVKVSKDGRICILSREGASNRKNGIVILDVKDPREPKILAEYTEELTGGVHNLFIDKGHVYALSAGRRYDVINIEDPRNPKKVGSYQIFEPGASIHDVWIEDGIAYSSNWRYGVHMVDVGNGVRGGSPSDPKKISSYAYPNGANHAAFPYKSKATGKSYVIAGDEMFPFGLNTKDKPTYARGWMHFIDFTDLDNPKEVARYQVPEAGTHNLWVEGDLLYAAYYNGGLRVVDLSGDLMGDLYNQGREIATYLPADPKGYIANAPMVWGPQPHKGHIFFSDWNSGLYAVKLEPEPRQ